MKVDHALVFVLVDLILEICTELRAIQMESMVTCKELMERVDAAWLVLRKQLIDVYFLRSLLNQ